MVPPHPELPTSRVRRSISLSPARLILVVFGVLIVGLGGWFGVRAISSVRAIIDTPSDSASPILEYFGKKVDPNALAGEGDGRVNVLVMGIGGTGHAGGSLADTIMVVSLDPDDHQLALLSIPRDLRVPIPGFGQNKINAAHSLGEQREKGSGPKLMKETVSQLLDLPIHYYVRIDFAGFTKIVDKLGGLIVDVSKPLSDPFYPDDATDGYSPFSLKAGRQTLSGAVALKYARSRETTSDFDRAARQQQLVLALKEKLLSLNVVGNPKKLSELLGIVGEHVRTDLSITDLDRLVKLSSAIDPAGVTTVVLDNGAAGPLTTLTDGGYYLVPKRGDFRDVQRIAHELFREPHVRAEAATVVLVNATGQSGEGAELKHDLTSLGYTVTSVTEGGVVPTTSLVDQSNGRFPYTVSFLKQRFHATVTIQSPDSSTTNPADLVLTVGRDWLTSASR